MNVVTTAEKVPLVTENSFLYTTQSLKTFKRTLALIYCFFFSHQKFMVFWEYYKLTLGQNCDDDESSPEEHTC